MSRKLKIALFVLALISLGFFREYLFVSINAILYNKFFNPTGHRVHEITPALQFLNAFSYNTIYTAKWFITPLFVFIFWFLQKQFLQFLFHEKKTGQWLRVLYLSLLLLAGISLGTGWVVAHLNEGYLFSRIFMGLAQSPAPCMILIPLTYFYKNHNTEI